VETRYARAAERRGNPHHPARLPQSCIWRLGPENPRQETIVESSDLSSLECLSLEYSNWNSDHADTVGNCRLTSRQPDPGDRMICAQENHSVGSLTPNRLKTWHYLRNFAPIGFARYWLAVMLMQMNVENSFTQRAAMIYGMHGPGDGLAVDTSANIGIVDVAIIGDAVISRDKDQFAAGGKATHATGYESNSLRRKAMR